MAAVEKYIFVNVEPLSLSKAWGVNFSAFDEIIGFQMIIFTADFCVTVANQERVMSTAVSEYFHA